MYFHCGKSRRLVPALATLVVVIMSGLCTQASAALADDVQEFLTDFDRLVAKRDEIAADRTAMATNLNNEPELRKSVRQFFVDRSQALLIRKLKAADRKQMRISLNYVGTKIAKPTKGTGVLLTDATSYITNYDGWVLQQTLVQGAIAEMRVTLAAGDVTGLTAATTAFFDRSRARHQHRLQWQLDIRSMKKDVAFKGTGKPQKISGSTLTEHVTEFLADRNTWEALGLQINVDREAIRAALSSSTGLEAAVVNFLTTRRSRRIKGDELALDRKAMRADISFRDKEKERKPGEMKSKDEDNDDEDVALEEGDED